MNVGAKIAEMFLSDLSSELILVGRWEGGGYHYGNVYQ